MYITVNPDDAVAKREASKTNFTVKQAEEKEDCVKHGYVIVPKEDPTYFNEDVERCVRTLGSYKDCPVCGKQFYIQPGCESRWAYRDKNKKQVCTYSCMRKSEKG